MRLRALVCFVLLTSTGFAATETSPNLLGLSYSEWFAANASQIATDNSGALYILAPYAVPGENDADSVTKLSPDGTTVLWQNMLGFLASSMAVSPPRATSSWFPNSSLQTPPFMW
jgi:hypothetical protein